MRLSIEDLINLVASGVPDPVSRIERVFEWDHSRRIEVVKWLLAASIALFIPVVVAYLKGDIISVRSSWWMFALLFCSVLLAVLGLGLLYRTRRIHRSYVFTLSLLGELQKISTFLQRYREEGRQ
jgi:hypothetical protein